MKDFDLIVIGGGSAGYAAASAATQLGLRAAVVEGGAELGGLCILRGCMPSKALIASANRANAVRGAGIFGVEVPPPTIQPSVIHARKARHVAGFAEYRAKQLTSGRFAFFRGWAGFVDPHTVEIRAEDGTSRRLSSETFLLATGSRTRSLEIPGLAETGFLDSDAVLAQPRLPRSVVILGGGPTAVEFAHYYAGLGTQVTLIQRGEQLLKDMDGDVARTLAESFRKRGMRVYCHTAISRVQRSADGGKEVLFTHGGKTRSAVAEEIVFALGRVPQWEGLELSNAGLEIQRGTLSVNAAQQTSVPHIFAAGDAAGPYEVVHLAIAQGELAARNAARLIGKGAGRGGRPLEEMDYRLRLFAVFTDPEIAAVGMTERELQAEGVPYRVASYPFDDHGKSILMEETTGFVKLIASEETGEIVGGAVIGPRASDLIQEIVVAMRFHASARQLMEIPHYHPTLSEIWTYPAEELAEGM